MYQNLDDKEIVKLAQQGNNDAVEYLMKKYKNSIVYMAMPYCKCGLELEDLMQEGRIALYKSIMSYVDKNCSFKTFMCVCVRRKLITAVRTRMREKHKPLNQAINGILYSIDIVDNDIRPDDVLEAKELIQTIRKEINCKLTKLEARILKMSAIGYRRKEIATTLSKKEKDIENALLRSRYKMRKLKERYNAY